MLNNSSEDFLFDWNLRFKYDRRWRKKYNIPFGSEQHLKANQIDIYLDLKEDRLFDKLKYDYLKAKKDKEDLELTGKLLKEQTLSKEDDDEMFKHLRLQLKAK